MRRHPPSSIRLSKADRSEFQELVRAGHTPQRIARRARVLLAMEKPETVVQALAAQVALTRSSIWRLCCRYEQQGAAAVQDAPRSGRPRQLSPLGAGANRATGLL